MISTDIKYQAVEPILPGLQRGLGELRYARVNERKPFALAFVSVWLCGWTVGGIAAVSELLHPHDHSPSFFLVFWLAGWALGWVAAAFHLVWSIAGQQTIVATPVALTHIAAVGPIRRVRHFAPAEVRDLRWLDRETVSRGGEFMRNASMIKFDYGAKTIDLFKGISRPEAVALIDGIKSVLRIEKAMPQ